MGVLSVPSLDRSMAVCVLALLATASPVVARPHGTAPNTMSFPPIRVNGTGHECAQLIHGTVPMPFNSTVRGKGTAHTDGTVLPCQLPINGNVYANGTAHVSGTVHLPYPPMNGAFHHGSTGRIPSHNRFNGTCLSTPIKATVAPDHHHYGNKTIVSQHHGNGTLNPDVHPHHFGPTNGTIGAASVINHCVKPVYVKAVHGVMPGYVVAANPAYIELLPGERMEEAFSLNPNAGTSIKIATENDASGQGPHVQLEFTPNMESGQLFYDLSNVNAHPRQGPVNNPSINPLLELPESINLLPHPFAAEGMRLELSDPDCADRVCHPGELVCKQAYLDPKDDWNTKACPDPEDISMVLDLCPYWVGV